MFLTYHKIGNQFELGITTVTRKKFAAHLDLFDRLGLKTRRASGVAGEAAGVVAGAVDAPEVTGRPGEGGSVAITFDDGYESVWSEALPEMARRRMVGTVFVVVGAVGKNNTWDVRLSPKPFRHLAWPQILELHKAGFEIGSHTLSHRDLTRLDPTRLKEELAASRKAIEDRLGSSVTAISYPFGRYSQRVIGVALEAGYTSGFTSSANDGTEPMAIGRLGVYSIDTEVSLQRKLRLRTGYALECLKSRVISGLSLGTTLIRK
jgi:peptidoglycan/xylan/chitin deacetylase (PgdA/CDA1 family)